MDKEEKLSNILANMFLAAHRKTGWAHSFNLHVSWFTFCCLEESLALCLSMAHLEVIKQMVGGGHCGHQHIEESLLNIQTDPGPPIQDNHPGSKQNHIQ